MQCTTSVLIDDGDDGETPRLLFTLEHVVHDGRKGRHGAYNVASQRLEFVGGQVEQIRVGSGSINADGGVSLVMARFGNDVTPPGRMPGENAMKANERMARRGYERRQARKQLDGLHHAMGLATPPRALELVGDAAVTEHGQALEAERGAHAVAEESLTSNAIVGFDSNARVQIEAERLESVLAFGAAGSRECSIDAHASIRRLNELPLVEPDEPSLAQRCAHAGFERRWFAAVEFVAMLSLEMIRNDLIEDGFFGLVALMATCCRDLETNGSNTHGANQGEHRAEG